MSLGLVVALLFAVSAQTPQPSAEALASSVVVFDPAGSVIVFDPAGSVTVLQTESKRGAQTVITISSDVLFDFGSAVLTPAATGKLKDLAGRIAGSTQPVAVVGYTDSIGNDASNAALSNQRAQAAGAVLKSALPAGPPVTTEGRGAKEPVAPNSTGGNDDPEGRAKNRRVTVSFTPGGP